MVIIIYDIYAQKSNYPFKGVVYNQYRYFQEDTTLTIKGETFTYKKGDKNPFFKNKPDEFVFNITDQQVIDKKQPLTNLIVRSEQLQIDTKFKHPNFVQGGYIGFRDKLWVIQSAHEEPGPQKSLYSFFNVNSLSTIKMVIEEAQE